MHAKETTFATEVLTAALLEEMKPLFADHFAEIQSVQGYPLRPNYEAYLSFETQGLLKVFTVRSETKLVGYSVFFVKRSLHFTDLFEAVHDLLFVHPDYRRGSLGYRFIKWCDDELKSLGVKMVFQNVSYARDFSPLLKRLGYQIIDVIYARRLN